MKRLISFFLLLTVLTGCQVSPVPDEIGIPSTMSPTASASPSPSPTPLPTPVPLDFTLDHTKLPAEHASVLELAGNTADWNALVAAICAQKATCSLSNPGAANDLLLVFSASPYAAVAQVNLSGDTLQITYAENASVEELETAVVEIMNGTLSASCSDTETALLLYRTVSSSFTYEESEANSLYRMLVERKGGTKEFAAALQYLLSQADIFSLTAESTLSGFTHYWVIAEFSGVTFHLDPVFEQTTTGGLGLSYFGMSDAAHKDALGTGQYEAGLLSEPHDALCPDDLYGGLFTDVTDWTLDVLSHELTLAYGGDAFSTTVHTEEIDIP